MNFAAIWAGLYATAQSSAQNVQDATQAAVATNLDTLREQASEAILKTGAGVTAAAAASVAPAHPASAFIRAHAPTLLGVAGVLVLVLVLVAIRRRSR